MTDILGISAFYHDSAAALVRDGEIVAAAQEERFTRKKHDPGFPRHSMNYCLREAGSGLNHLESIVFYEKPLVKFERLLETYLAFAPKGIRSFVAAMPVWLKEKLFLKDLIKKEIRSAYDMDPKVPLPPILFSEHHQSHAASAFYPSPYDSAAVLCVDGVGEWATTSAWFGKQNTLTPLWEIPFPHSIGLLYTAFTYYTGFKVNSGEYKVMGLAPYGRPIFVQKILDHLIDLKSDGTFRLNMDYFDYCTGMTMTNNAFSTLFEGPPRQPESPLTQREMDLARSVQDVTESIMLRLAKTLRKETDSRHLCLAGGVALNCVGNGKILREGTFDEVWIQPAAGDAGGAIGSALTAWHELMDKPRQRTSAIDTMKGSFLGPSFTNKRIREYLDANEIPYAFLDDEAFMEQLAASLSEGKVIGWFQGRMEFGPRALGGRSIIGDPRNEKMQSIMNLKIKYRESFRPFAPSVLRERVSDYFDLSADSPYMLLVAPIQERLRATLTPEEKNLWGIDLLNVRRSDIPAVTHVDYSARVQTVHEETNPRFHELLKNFERITGCGVLVNTSFNVRGEPIVCTPQDAYRCFMRTEMDVLALENCVLTKSDQPQNEEGSTWQSQFELD